jgi:hypothetical protein
MGHPINFRLLFKDFSISKKGSDTKNIEKKFVRKVTTKKVIHTHFLPTPVTALSF